MGNEIHFKINDVRNAANQIKADGDQFKKDVVPKVAELDLPFTAFPIAVPPLKDAYHMAQEAVDQVTASLGESLVAIGEALGRVATYYEAVEQKHKKELGITVI